MERRLISLLGAAAFGIGALTLAQDEPAKSPAVAEDPAPVAAEAPNDAQPGKELPEVPPGESVQLRRARLLVLDLASESYRAREEASRGLWELGVIGIEAIKKGVKSADPEVAYRSKILLQRIRTGITPDTPKSVVALVQKYFRSGVNGKKAVFESLLKERAYTQVLRIYRHEEDEASREACEEIVEKAVLPATLPALMDGRVKDGEELLRLAPVTDQNTRRLAALLRTEGLLEKEIASSSKRLSFEPNGEVSQNSMEAALHHLALLRSRGEVAEARELAEKMGREDLVAGLALFEGDPIPYLKWFMDLQEESPVARIHAEIVLNRWQGNDAEGERLLNKMAKEASAGGEEERAALLSLLLNGNVELGIPLVAERRKEAAFLYYETVELPMEALKIYGYPEAAEKKKEWLEERYALMRTNWTESDPSRYEVLTIASFLYTRGEREEGTNIMKALSEIGWKEGMKNWLEFIGRLSNLGGSLHELCFLLASERVTAESADEDDAKVIYHLFGEGDSALHLWNLLESIEEDKSKRIMLLGAVYGLVHMDEARLQEALVALDEKVVKGAPKDHAQRYADLLEAAEYRDDATVALALLERLAKLSDGDKWGGKLAGYHGYVSDWQKAIDAYDQLLKVEPTNVRSLALYGSAKIRAGRPEDAREPLRKVEQFGLDEPIRLYHLASDVERNGVVEKSQLYWRQLLLSNPPTDWIWQSAVPYFVKHARRKKQWRIAAAFSEVDALQSMKIRTTYLNPITAIRKRFAADLYRGLALLEEGDKENAMRLLRKTFELLNGDGLLADDYFPLLREAGEIEEHDRNFEIVYQRIEESIKAFPKAHNTYNSAAWMASRASRQLEDAHEKIRKALSMRPKQAAYLDTMAEVWFAKGDREQAVEWSRKAVQESFHGGSSSGAGVGLREQYDRFRSAEYPVP